ncbi:MAG: hypothetical protein M1815_002732 [Lichina confinis]|nr:MAG: hypothetical protein M1815_002732 [Lichina confinis]
MQLTNGAFLGLALASLTVAQGRVSFTSVPTSVKAGEPVVVEYDGDLTQSATIILRQGDPDDLATVETITRKSPKPSFPKLIGLESKLTNTPASATGGSFTWTPSQDLNGDDYALEIRQGDSENFTGLISVSGDGPGTSPSSISASITSAVSSVSSAASSLSSEVSESVSEISSSVESEISSILESASSVLNSTMETLTATEETTTSETMTSDASGISGTGSSTMDRNTTMLTPTLSSTATETETETETDGASRTRSTSSPSETVEQTTDNSAAGLASPLALVLGAVAALVYLN